MCDCRPGPVVGIEDHFYNYIIYQLSFGILAPVYEVGMRGEVLPALAQLPGA